jgi:hypothetical protein
MEFEQVMQLMENKDFWEYTEKAQKYIETNRPDILDDFLDKTSPEQVLEAMAKGISPEEFVNSLFSWDLTIEVKA